MSTFDAAVENRPGAPGLFWLDIDGQFLQEVDYELAVASLSAMSNQVEGAIRSGVEDVDNAGDG